MDLTLRRYIIAEICWLVFDSFVHKRRSISQERVLSQVDMALAQENQIIQVQF